MTRGLLLVSLSALAAAACHGPAERDIEPASENAADATGQADSEATANTPDSVATADTPLLAARLPRVHLGRGRHCVD